MSPWLNTMEYIELVWRRLFKSHLPWHSSTQSLSPPIPHPEGETRQVQCPMKERKIRVLSSGQLLPCGNGSPMLLDFLTSQEKMQIWNFIQISKFLNIISNFKKEKSLSQTKHWPVGWTQCMGCQCVVPELFGTRGTASHTALALFHFSLSRVWLPKLTTNTFAPDRVLARRASVARRFLNKDPILYCHVEQRLPADVTFPKRENEKAKEKTCCQLKWMLLPLYSILSSSWQVHACNGDFSFNL